MQINQKKFKERNALLKLFFEVFYALVSVIPRP